MEFQGSLGHWYLNIRRSNCDHWGQMSFPSVSGIEAYTSKGQRDLGADLKILGAL